MKFQLTAKVEKQLWTNDEAWLYQVKEQISSDKTKNWTLFTKMELSVSGEYQFAGYVSESKDKKTKTQDGKDIWRATFNAEQVALAGDIPF